MSKTFVVCYRVAKRRVRPELVQVCPVSVQRSVWARKLQIRRAAGLPVSRVLKWA